MVQINWKRITTEMGPVYNVHEQWRSISKFYQWMSEQKDFHCGAAECKPTQWNAWRLVRGFRKTTCDQTTRLVRLHKALLAAQPMPNSMISSPSCKTLQTDFEISPKNHTMPECHANLFLTETPCRLLEKATWARIMFNWQTKILWICEHTSQCWQRGNSAWISSDHTITHPWQTDACCTFYWTH